MTIQLIFCEEDYYHLSNTRLVVSLREKQTDNLAQKKKFSNLIHKLLYLSVTE